MFVLRPNGSEYARENLQEMAGLGGQSIPIADWPGARCSLDFCVIDLPRGDRRWIVLLARSKNRIDERALAAHKICRTLDGAVLTEADRERAHEILRVLEAHS